MLHYVYNVIYALRGRFRSKSSPYGSYRLGYIRATKVITIGCNFVRKS